MHIKVKRAFYGDEKGVKAGEVIEVADLRGRELIQRGLAEQLPAEKADKDHPNKADRKPKNKQSAG